MESPFDETGGRGSGHDESLSGHTIWHLPDYTLHALYDNVDNVALCISLFQPGTYREAH